ncbi:MAG: TetR/AcrR family transcriptional regulator [Marinilabiliaceae bacterium]|jgi:AcrR family transcriptional regulator|nr:TetR/AcrR family transcriptional regulator [Marinilabiliaceae bacterium]
MDYSKRISEEAEKLFMKYGIRTVTMDMIAHELGISKRTIYENFSDKDSLVTHVIRERALKQKESFKEIMKSSANVIDVVFTIIETAGREMRDTNPNYMLDLKKYHHKVFRLLCDRGEIRNSEMSLDILRRGVEEKIFRYEINIELVNEGIQGFIDSIQENELFHSSKYSKFEIFDNILFSYLKGISTDEGNKIIDEYRKKLGIIKNGNDNEN